MAENLRMPAGEVYDDGSLVCLLDQFAEEDGARLLQMYLDQADAEDAALDALCRRRMAKHLSQIFFLRFSRGALKAAACLLAMMVISGMLGLFFYSEARAAMIRWITRAENEAITYSPVVQESDSDEFLQYEIRALPEGYSLLEELSSVVPGFLVYENSAGKQLTFLFQPPDGRGKLYMIPGEDEIRQVTVNGVAADLYLPAEEGKSSTIVWTDPDTGYLLSVKGVFETDVLMELAESVVCLDK